MNIDEKTMHVISMSEYVKRITVKEFFEVLENAMDRFNCVKLTALQKFIKILSSIKII